FQVSTTRAAVAYDGYGFAQVHVPAQLPTQTSRYYTQPVEAHRPFSVTSAGTYKYYANIHQISGAGDADSFFDLQITAMYFPSAYGTVDKSGSAQEGGTQLLPTGSTSTAQPE
ncbi:hypothetical protein LDC_2016, partial [sediment metagenome]